jgi:cytoskeletal protein RodZ
MFEIGSSLREARERRNLSYGQVEAETAIRTRYVRALEDEDFHILPGPTYTKGFLRAYAEYLGLDGQPFVDEFNSRHHDPRGSIEHTPIASRPRSRPAQRRRQRRESNLIMIALAGIVAVVSLVFLATRFPPPQAAPYNTNTGTTTTHSTTGATTGTTSSTTQTTPQKGGGSAKTFHVVLSISRPTWIAATLGSPTGKPVVAQGGYALGTKGTIVDPAAHPTLTFAARKPVFLALGAPANVTVEIDGHQLTLPHVAAGQLLRLTKSGARVA